MKRTRRHVTSKLIAFVLSVLTLFYAIPAIVYAEAIDAIGSLAAESDSVPDGEATAADYDAPIYEVKSLREEAVKHFRLPDGSYVAAQYQYPVHYEDENGVMQDIDNSLYEGSGGVYTNENSRIKFAKKITGNQEIFALHDGNTKLTFSLIGAKKGTAGVVYNSEEDNSVDELQKMMLVDIGDTAHEMTVSVGNGTLLGYAACAGFATLPVPGARTIAAFAAGAIFIYDMFN